MGFAPVTLPLFALCVFRKRKTVPVESGQDGGAGDPQYVALFETRAFWIIFCGIVGCAALWALFEALLSAWQAGVVSLPGHRGHPRPVVPWPQAWAYLSGLLAVAVGALGSRMLSRRSKWNALHTLGAALLVVVGYVLVLFAEVLSSLKLTLALLLYAIAMAVALQIGRKYGRAAAVAALIGFVWVFLYVRDAV